MQTLGPINRTGRGFELIEFKDIYGITCSIQQSSLATEPALWLGVNDAGAKVMKSEAPLVGLAAQPPIEGWMPYPIPKQVLLSTRMHLNAKQVKVLIRHLQAWLKTESFKCKPSPT